jgi:hypothetical protein
MFAFLRRRRTANLSSATFCEGCGQVCTAQCRAAAHYDRDRTAALAYVIR